MRLRRVRQFSWAYIFFSFLALCPRVVALARPWIAGSPRWHPRRKRKHMREHGQFSRRIGNVCCVIEGLGGATPIPIQRDRANIGTLALPKRRDWRYCLLICWKRKTLFVHWNSTTHKTNEHDLCMVKRVFNWNRLANVLRNKTNTILKLKFIWLLD